MNTPKNLLACQNQLGEGPIWDHTNQQLYWIDIELGTIHRYTPSTKTHHHWTMPDKIGSIALHQDGGLLVALFKGLIHFDPNTETLTTLADILANDEPVRFNDGSCDRAGRFWVGTADVDANRPIANLHRYLGGKHAPIIDKGFIISNGIGWSPDNRTMYLADSEDSTIYHYDYDINTGEISNRRTFRQVPTEEGLPDGLTVDAEGYIWSAHWHGWRITRYTPDAQIDKIIKIPAPHVTSCCFGGPDLKQLFISTARVMLTDTELAEYPQAGDLFILNTEVAGLAEPYFQPQVDL